MIKRIYSMIEYSYVDSTCILCICIETNFFENYNKYLYNFFKTLRNF